MSSPAGERRVPPGAPLGAAWAFPLHLVPAGEKKREHLVTQSPRPGCVSQVCVLALARSGNAQ